MPLTIEHVLSQKNLGGRLVSPDAVCKPCNGLAGSIESMVAAHPFVSEAVAKFRTMPGGKAFPQSQAVLPDGAKVHVERRPSHTEIVAYTPRHVSTDPDGTEVWEVAAGQEDEFVERRRKRGERVRAVGRPLGPGGPMELHYDIGVRNFGAWGRFVAKVALGTMSLIVPQHWLDTDGALALQDMFHERRRPGAPYFEVPLYPWEQDTSKPPWSLLNQGQHVVGLWRDEDTGGIRFLLALFGYLGAEAEIRDIELTEEPVWLVPSDETAPTRFTRTTFNDWLAAQIPQP